MIRRDPLRPFRGRVDAECARHYLRRTGFGAPPRTVAKVVADGLESHLDSAFAARESELGDIELAAALGIDSAAATIVGALLATERPERLKLALFWHGHFATSNDKVDSPALLLRQFKTFELLGPLAFEELVVAMTRDAAMLVWLDAEKNRKGHPNENFARELFELFTLGHGHYTERDIQEAARACTGWRRADSRFEFVPALHDSGAKTVFGETRDFDAESVARHAARQPATARYLAAKLLRFYGDPEPDTVVIEAFADRLRTTGLEVGRALRDLFASEWFLSTERRGARIASPVEFVVGHLRTLGSRPAPSRVEAAIRRLGQALLRPPTVKGWDGEAAWVHSATALARIAVAQRIARGDLGGSSWDESIEERLATVDDAARTLLAAPLDPATARSVAARGATAPHSERAAILAAVLLSLPEASLT